MPTHLRYRPGATDAAPPDALTTMWSRRDEAAEVPQPIGKRDRATAPPPWAVTQATTPQSTATATATATAIPPRTATEQPPTWAPEAIAADLAVTYALRRSPRLPRPRLPRPRYRHTATYRDRDTATPPRTATEQPPAWAVTYATAQQSSATARLHHRVPRPRDCTTACRDRATAYGDVRDHAAIRGYRATAATASAMGVSPPTRSSDSPAVPGASRSANNTDATSSRGTDPRPVCSASRTSPVPE